MLCNPSKVWNSKGLLPPVTRKQIAKSTLSHCLSSLFILLSIYLSIGGSFILSAALYTIALSPSDVARASVAVSRNHQPIRFCMQLNFHVSASEPMRWLLIGHHHITLMRTPAKCEQLTEACTYWIGNCSCEQSNDSAIQPDISDDHGWVHQVQNWSRLQNECNRICRAIDYDDAASIFCICIFLSF